MLSFVLLSDNSNLENKSSLFLSEYIFYVFKLKGHLYKNYWKTSLEIYELFSVLIFIKKVPLFKPILLKSTIVS